MKILLISGGIGSEHEVSKMGANNVLAALRETNHEVSECEIAKDGTWSIPFNSLGGYDVLFPLVHGAGGEDGAIATLGKLSGVSVVGCDVSASALAWDKDVCKIILQKNGIPVVPWETLRHGERMSYKTACDKLGGQVFFIKPACEGSSVGVSRVTDEAELSEAIDLAFSYDEKILIEPAILGRELECAVLGNAPEIEVTNVGEIKPPQDDFYSYDEKYSNKSQTGLDIPAQNLDNKIRSQIQDLAKQAFNVIGGRGLARIDFFYDEVADQVYINEINTMPGFTNISMYPKLWENAGLTYDKLLEKLIELAR
jgi:D-alanine-D-alanine ligase